MGFECLEDGWFQMDLDIEDTCSMNNAEWARDWMTSKSYENDVADGFATAGKVFVGGVIIALAAPWSLAEMNLRDIKSWIPSSISTSDSSDASSSSSASTFYAARIGDMHVCPMVTGTVPHVGGPVAMGESTVLIGGMPAARLGDMCTCSGPPDSIVMGSAGVLVGGSPAARMGDSTAHGGKIMAGCPTVIIGESIAGSGGSRAFSSSQMQALEDAAESGEPYCEETSETSEDESTSQSSEDQSEENSASVALVNEEGENGSIKAFYAEAEEIEPTQEGALGAGGKVEAGMLSMEGDYDYGVVGGEVSMDTATVSAGGYAGTNFGVGANGNAEIKLKDASANLHLGTEDTLAVAGEMHGELLSASVDGDILLGDDGRRVGFILEGEAGAAAASGDLTGGVNIPIPFTDYSFNVTTSGGAGGGAASIGAGVRAYHDWEEERAHLGGSIRAGLLIEGELDVDISFGTRPDDVDDITDF